MRFCIKRGAHKKGSQRAEDGLLIGRDTRTILRSYKIMNIRRPDFGVGDIACCPEKKQVGRILGVAHSADLKEQQVILELADGKQIEAAEWVSAKAD
jgi:hypothetical protein